MKVRKYMTCVSVCSECGYIPVHMNLCRIEVKLWYHSSGSFYLVSLDRVSHQLELTDLLRLDVQRQSGTHLLPPTLLNAKVTHSYHQFYFTWILGIKLTS